MWHKMCVYVCTWWLTQFALSLRITRANSWLLFIDDLFHTNNSSAFFQTFSNDTSPLRTKWDMTHPLVVALQFLLFFRLNFSIIHVLSKINTEYLMIANTILSACRYNYATSIHVGYLFHMWSYYFLRTWSMDVLGIEFKTDNCSKCTSKDV